MRLKLSEQLSLPDDVATQTLAFLGRKGGGKTYAAGKLVELLLGAHVQVVVLDTVGNWYGLRLGADGKSAGFDIPVLGGLRGDIPLEEGAGELIADTLADTGRSAVLDISQFSLGARQRFATAFGERLWARKKADRHPTPLHLVIEESQLIVPQLVRPEQRRMVGIYEEIIRLGRNYGIGVCMLSQRPQSVNKEVLNQTECLFVFQTNGKQERDALKSWIVAQGADVDLVQDLPALPVGTGYVWSPQWLQIFKRVKVAPKQTFDSTATPKVGVQRPTARTLTPLNLDDLRDKMQSVVDRAAAADPVALQRRIATLERELTQLRKKPPEPEGTHPVAVDDMDALGRMAKQQQEWTTQFSQLVTRLGKALPRERTAAASLAPAPIPVPAPRSPRSAQRVEPQTGASKLASGERKILTALAQYPAGRTKKQVAVLCTYAHNGGGFNNYLAALRSRGLIEGRDLLQITEAGLVQLGPYTPLPTGANLREHWVRQLGKAERMILEALCGAYPSALDKAALGHRTGYEPGGGGFSNALSRLRTLELIEGRGELRASRELFA